MIVKCVWQYWWVLLYLCRRDIFDTRQWIQFFWVVFFAILSSQWSLYLQTLFCSTVTENCSPSFGMFFDSLHNRFCTSFLCVFNTKIWYAKLVICPLNSHFAARPFNVFHSCWRLFSVPVCVKKIQICREFQFALLHRLPKLIQQFLLSFCAYLGSWKLIHYCVACSLSNKKTMLIIFHRLLIPINLLSGLALDHPICSGQFSKRNGMFHHLSDCEEFGPLFFYNQWVFVVFVPINV